MRWEDFRRSENIEDSRGEDSGSGGIGLPGGIGFPTGGRGGLGIGTIVVLGLIGWALGIDPSLLIGGAEILTGGNQPRVEQPFDRTRIEQTRRQPNTGAPSDQAGDFVAAVLGNTEDTWQEIFRQGGQRYRAPRLRLFSGAIQGGCGFAQAAMGPFYCPNDQRIYLDTSFFREIETRFRGCSGKACQFSQAYVIAHEVGHHVQNLLGVLPKAQQAQQAAGSRAQANQIQVRVELQADCFAGVWAHHSEQRKAFLDAGDIDAALQTATAIGDDTLQRRSQGRVVPDSFTHGSAEQRKRWFSVGFQQGQLSACNTFQAANL
jgi:predicted metalloprotease